MQIIITNGKVSISNDDPKLTPEEILQTLYDHHYNYLNFMDFIKNLELLREDLTSKYSSIIQASINNCPLNDINEKPLWETAQYIVEPFITPYNEQLQDQYAMLLEDNPDKWLQLIKSSTNNKYWIKVAQYVLENGY